MASAFELKTEELKERAPELRIGDKVLLSGWIFTARDAAHKRFLTCLKEGRPLPVEINGAVVYYAGPTPAPEGRAIGSCGPTTSGRMDPFAPVLLDMGLAAMIGKGERNQAVRDAVVRNSAVYFCAVGGAGALAAACIKSCEVVAFEDLGCESVKKLRLEKFPLIVANDCRGGDLFSAGRARYQAS